MREGRLDCDERVAVNRPQIDSEGGAIVKLLGVGGLGGLDHARGAVDMPVYASIPCTAKNHKQDQPKEDLVEDLMKRARVRFKSIRILIQMR